MEVEGAIQRRSSINIPWGPLEFWLKNKVQLHEMRFHEARKRTLFGNTSWSGKMSLNTLECQ